MMRLGLLFISNASLSCCVWNVDLVLGNADLWFNLQNAGLTFNLQNAGFSCVNTGLLLSLQTAGFAFSFQNAGLTRHSFGLQNASLASHTDLTFIIGDAGLTLVNVGLAKHEEIVDFFGFDAGLALLCSDVGPIDVTRRVDADPGGLTV